MRITATIPKDEKKVEPSEATPVFAAGKEIQEVFDKGTIAIRASQLSQIISEIVKSKEGGEAVIRKYAIRFKIRTHLEPMQLLGDSENLGHRCMTELVAMLALAEHLSSVAYKLHKKKLAQTLNQTAVMLKAVIYQHIPDLESEATSLLYKYFVECISNAMRRNHQ